MDLIAYGLQILTKYSTINFQYWWKILQCLYLILDQHWQTSDPTYMPILVKYCLIPMSHWPNMFSYWTNTGPIFFILGRHWPNIFYIGSTLAKILDQYLCQYWCNMAQKSQKLISYQYWQRYWSNIFANIVPTLHQYCLLLGFMTRRTRY